MRNIGTLFTSAAPPAGVVAALVQDTLPTVQVLAGVLVAAWVCTIIFLHIFLVVVGVLGGNKHAARAERFYKLLLGRRRAAPPPKTPPTS